VVESISQVSLLFKLHIFLGITVFLVFPFSRLVHIWSAPVTYPMRAYQVVRQR
jgi:nitrate reductase gamma subunit